MPMTRRTLLNAMAKLGGAGAVYESWRCGTSSNRMPASVRGAGQAAR
jgi:hypothetical protein